MSGVDSFAGPLGEVRNISGADTGLALTTTAGFIAFIPGTNYLVLTPNTAVTAKVIKWALNPWLVVLKTTNNLSTDAAITDGSEAVQDGDTSTNLNLNSFDTAANSNYLYLWSHVQYRGVRVIIGNTNSNAAVLTVKYWDGANFTDITATDGSASAGATFGQTGNVTWTVPTGWKKAAFIDTGVVTMSPSTRPSIFSRPGYWTRWETSAAFDATVTATGMLAMNRNTTYGAFDVSVGREMRVRRGIDGHGNIEALTDAGTANLLIEAAVTNVGATLG